MIRRLLVANRGEVARRIFRTCRDLGVATAAVYEEPDRDEPFVREADEAVPVGSYLAAEEIVAAAARVGADAVHPGWGFLAEDARFAERCLDAGLAFVGPPPDVLAAAGSKLRSRALAEGLGVPVLPAGDESGFPALVKASYGGGGRGMRLVHGPGELALALESAEREAAAAFGDGALFLERYLEGARHVEVQILGDAAGTVTHLFGRECSVQRRWQKVIEEAPVRDERLLEAAVRIGEALGYVGAGTVEFLVAPDGAFYFLEVNARLQVEHPVTELVTGLDLVALQLRLAEGGPVPDGVTVAGHAVEARLYAEGAGTLHRFRAGGVRVDSGVEDGSEVSARYDPLLAKLVAHGPTRGEAIRRLAAALRGARIHGVPTNRDLLLAVLEHPAFLAGEVDTQFLEGADLVRAAFDERLHAAAAALAGQAARRSGQSLPSGWRNNPSQLQRASFEDFDVGYRLSPLVLEVNGDPLEARLHACTPDLVELEAGGVRRRIEVHLVGDTAYVDSPLGSSALRELPRFPPGDAGAAAGSLVAPMPGSVVRVAVEPGQEVERGQPLVVVEAMKMEHTVAAPRAGRVAEVRVAQGEQVDGGRVLVVLEEAGD